MKKVYLIIVLALLSLLVFAAIPDYYDDNYPNFTPDQKANYILSMEGGLNLEEARTLLIENKMSSSVKRSLGKEYFRESLGVSIFEITDKAEFNLVVKSTDYLETKLTSVAVSQLKLLAKAPNVKGFKILADGKIDVKSDKTSLFDISSNIESVKSFTNGFEIETSSGYINFNQDGNMIKAQRIRYLDSGIEIENPAPAVPCYIKSGSDTLSIETFKDGAILTLAKNPSGRITSINGNAMYRLKAGEFNADIAPESIFNIRYDSGNPKYLIQGLADARYGLVKTRSTDKNTVVSFEQIGNENMFNMYGAGEVTYADYYKGVAFAEGTISGKFNVNDFEINTEMAKNDFAFKKDGNKYDYDIVDVNNKQFYSLSSLDLGQRRDINPQVEGSLIFDIDTPEKVSRFGRLRYKRNRLERSVDDANFDIDDGTIAMPSIGYSVWQDPAGFYLQLNGRGEVYITTNVLREIISEDAVSREFHLAGEGGSPYFMRRTAKGFEIYDYSEPSHKVILHTENIDFNDVEQYRKFTERLTRVWQK